MQIMQHPKKMQQVEAQIKSWENFSPTCIVKRTHLGWRGGSFHFSQAKMPAALPQKRGVKSSINFLYIGIIVEMESAPLMTGSSKREPRSSLNIYPG